MQICYHTLLGIYIFLYVHKIRYFGYLRVFYNVMLNNFSSMVYRRKFVIAEIFTHL